MDYRETEKITVRIIEQYYKGNLEPFFDRMHPDVIVLSVGRKMLFQGKKNIIEQFGENLKKDMRYEIESMECSAHQLSSSICFVLLEMNLFAYYPDGRIEKVNQRVTVNWKYYKAVKCEDNTVLTGWIAMSAHISVGLEADSPVVNMAHFSENIVREAIAQIRDEQRYQFRDVKGRLHYASSLQVLRVQSDRSYSYIYLKEEKKIRVYKSITELEQELGVLYLRIHKSHLVNKNHIMDIRNYKAIISDGTVLPVSQKRFAEIKNSWMEFKKEKK